MSIKYSVVSNPLQPGRFYPRPVALQTRRLQDLAQSVSRRRALAPATVMAAVTAIIEEIVSTLADGDRVSIDGLADLCVRLSQSLDSACDRFDFDKGGNYRDCPPCASRWPTGSTTTAGLPQRAQRYAEEMLPMAKTIVKREALYSALST